MAEKGVVTGIKDGAGVLAHKIKTFWLQDLLCGGGGGEGTIVISLCKPQVRNLSLRMLQFSSALRMSAFIAGEMPFTVKIQGQLESRCQMHPREVNKHVR